MVDVGRETVGLKILNAQKEEYGCLGEIKVNKEQLLISDYL